MERAFLVIPGKLTIPFSKFEKLEWSEWEKKMYIYFDGQFLGLTAAQTKDVEEQIRALSRAQVQPYYVPPFVPEAEK